MLLYDPNAMLSEHYSLGNLTVTNQQLSAPNMPESADHFQNLTYTADILERLDHEVGPFRILSGYRTKELQNALAAAGEPTATGTSFHEIGRAVDIAPTTMTPAEYFGRILANENLKSQFSEISIKPSQNALHLAINIPGDVRDPKVMGLNDAGSYVRLTLDEITSYIQPFMASAQDAYDYAAAQLVTFNRTPLILGMVAAVGGVLYFALAGGKRVRANPRHRTYSVFGRHLDNKKLAKAYESLMKKHKDLLTIPLRLLDRKQMAKAMLIQAVHKEMKMRGLL